MMKDLAAILKQPQIGTMRTSRYYEAIRATKRRLLIAALKRHGTMREAAEELGISASTICRECQRLGITVQTSRVVEVA